MRLGIMQPYLFPYLGYFQLIGAVDKFVLLNDVQYINRGWINRNRILINGQATLVTIPLEKASQNKLIKDINLVQPTIWAPKILKTIEQAYCKAPFFNSVYLLLKNIINYPELNLSRFIEQSLRQLIAYMHLKTEVVPGSAGYATEHLKAQEKILAICQKEKASHYINPVGGTELYDKEAFAQKQIKLSFLRPGLGAYKQKAPSFVPGLSIIDVLMYNSPDEISTLLQDYTLE